MSEPLYTVVATAGKFDQIFDNDIQFLEHAKSLGDELVVLMYNDHRIRDLSRGCPPCMLGKKLDARIEQLESLDCVDVVIPTQHGQDFRYQFNDIPRNDLSVGYELSSLMPHLFVTNSPRVYGHNEKACEDLGIEIKIALMEDYHGRRVSV